MIMAKKAEEAKRVAEHEAEFEEYMASNKVLQREQLPLGASSPREHHDEASTRAASATLASTQRASASHGTRTEASTRAASATLASTQRASASPGTLLEEMAAVHAQQLRLAEVVLPNGEMHVAQSEVPRYVTMEVVLDSGAGAHVANKQHVP